jgi:hypothetical protein
VASVRGEIRAAIAARLKAALLGTCDVVSGFDQGQIATNRRPAIADVYWRETRYDRSKELGQVRQWEWWTWDIWVCIATTASPENAWEGLDLVLETIRTTLAPTAGYRPRTDCGALELQEEVHEGLMTVGRVVRATYTHWRSAS